MTRFPLFALVSCAILAVPASALAQDEVVYIDRAKKKNDEVHRGKVQQETIAGIVCSVGGTAKTQTFATADIVDIIYGIRLGLKPIYTRARVEEAKMDTAQSDAERLKAFEDAMKRYQELLKEKEVEDAPAVKRHIQFRVARLYGKLAEEDAEQRDTAITALDKFVKAYPDSWQLSLAVRLLGQLYEDKDDLNAAQKTYEVLASNPEAPKEMRLEFQMLSVRGLMRTSQFPAAEKKLGEIAATLSPNDPLGLRLQVFQAECQSAAKKYDQAQAKLKTILTADAADGVTKGLAHNVLGDCLRETGKLDEAFWNYLWVDTVYNQDRQEQARALYHLSKLFEQVKKDPNRAQQCRERLLTKEFAGTDFQRRAAKEK